MTRLAREALRLARIAYHPWSRRSPVVRHAAWHALRRVTGDSYLRLGQALGASHHTVRHGIAASRERCIESVRHEAKVDAIVAVLREAVS